MGTRKIFTMVVLVALFAILAFMFSNSLESVAKSQAKSLSVMKHVAPLLELLVGKGHVTDNLVRKLAHFFEFLSLGVGLIIFSELRFKTRLQNIANCLSIGLAIAVTDESLQLLSGRGSMVKDILLDFAGVTTGVVVSLLIHILSKSARSNRKHNQKQRSV